MLALDMITASAAGHAWPPFHIHALGTPKEAWSLGGSEVSSAPVMARLALAVSGRGYRQLLHCPLVSAVEA
jgi:hypothetical protein